MQRQREHPSSIVLPVRMSSAQYQELAALAALDQRTRCAMIRKLIADAARRTARSAQEEHAR